MSRRRSSAAGRNRRHTRALCPTLRREGRIRRALHLQIEAGGLHQLLQRDAQTLAGWPSDRGDDGNRQSVGMAGLGQQLARRGRVGLRNDLIAGVERMSRWDRTDGLTPWPNNVSSMMSFRSAARLKAWRTFRSLNGGMRLFMTAASQDAVGTLSARTPGCADTVSPDPAADPRPRRCRRPAGRRSSRSSPE
jgi:hypothetical protein